MTALYFPGQPLRWEQEPQLSILTSKGWQEAPSVPEFDPSTHSCSWSISDSDWVLTEISPPATVTKEQFVFQLHAEDLYNTVKTFINGTGIPEGPEKERAKIMWQHCQTVPRNGTIVALIMAHLGKDSAATDAFFRNASLL